MHLKANTGTVNSSNVTSFIIISGSVGANSYRALPRS